MKVFFGLILLFLTLNFSFSQEIGEEIKGDVTYKIHVVEQGNTLYGLKEKYNTTVDAIIKANPGAEDGIQVGQKLYIPVEKSIEKEAEKTHLVEAKETLFGISRKYNVSINDLIEANPGVEDGLDIGQELIIPQNEESPAFEERAENTNKIQDSLIIRYEVEFDDSIVKYTVQKKETLFSISQRFMVPVKELKEINELRNDKIKPGQVLIIPLKKERVERVEIRNIQPADTVKADTTVIKPLEIKEKYTVALFLPLKIEENGKVLSGLIDENTRLNNVSDIALDFLMGAQMALDSLEKMGLTAEVHILDTKGDLKVLNDLLEQKLMQKVDLVIGPFFPELVERTTQWCRQNEVEMIVPTSIPTKLLKDNLYVTAAVPSDLILIGAMAKYLAENHSDDKLFMVQGENEEVKNRIAYFKDIYERCKLDTFTSRGILMTELGSSSGRDLANKIDTDTSNFFICLSDNVQQVMSFINALNAAKNYSPRHNDAKITVVGTRNWQDITSLNNYYKNRFNLHFASSTFLNYESDTIVKFIDNYNKVYKAYPSKYSFHGFDVMLSQGSRVLLRRERKNGLINYFELTHVGEGHGKENRGSFICKQKDFEILLLKINKKSDYFGTYQRENN